jgi:CubicO group peptidase (beta-lactamase class C family)
VAYDDPKNDSSLMEATDDWVQYVIDRPMVAEPGKVFNYSSGVSELLAYIFEKETGQDIEKYGEKYLFTPLGMDHYWKRTYMGVVDTEGGLFLRASDLAKLGYLYLNDGMWDGQQVVSKEWVKESVEPLIDAEEDYKYGFKWWLLPRTDSGGYVWMARGFGGQRLMVFPDKDLIVVLTGWTIVGDDEKLPNHVLADRILAAVKGESRGGTQ